MGDFVTARLALPRCAAKLIECFQKERLDVVRLQSARFCALHVLPNTGDTASIHHVVRQSALFEQVLEVRTIDGIGDGLRQFCANFGALAVTDSLN
jgi:hypothetical protein